MSKLNEKDILSALETRHLSDLDHTDNEFDEGEEISEEQNNLT